MAGTASVYRIDTTGQNESNARTANQIIEFNTGATNPDALSFLESFTDHWVEDISKHPNPKKALNRLQDGLLDTRELILRGWFEDPDNAIGPIRISTWMKDAKKTASLFNGRFGIRIDDFSDLDIAPSATVAWILYDATVEIPADHPFEANFELKFWLSGTHP